MSRVCVANGLPGRSRHVLHHAAGPELRGGWSDLQISGYRDRRPKALVPVRPRGQTGDDWLSHTRLSQTGHMTGGLLSAKSRHLWLLWKWALTDQNPLRDLIYPAPPQLKQPITS